MKPSSMQVVIGGLRYTTEKSILLAHDVYTRPGRVTHNHGKNTFLFKTDNDNYFIQIETIGDKPKIIPITDKEAQDLYELELPEHEVVYEIAFPNVEVAEA